MREKAGMGTFLGVLFLLILASPVPNAFSRTVTGAGGTPSYQDLSSLSVVDHVENEREDLARVTTEIELHYRTVKSRSIVLALARISRSLTPFLLHPVFPVQVIVIDDSKPAGFYLGGETVVLTRGLVFSGRFRDTDTMAGLVALLLSRHDILDSPPSGVPHLAPSIIRKRNEAAKNAAMILLRAGYHYGGLLEAIRILDVLRSGPDWSQTIDWLNRNKRQILSETAELEDGVSLLLAGRPASSVPFLVRYVDAFPGSLEGRFWLGLAYYRDYFRTVPVSKNTFLFSVDPLPPATPFPAQEEKRRRWELEFADTIWSGILRKSPAFSPAWNAIGRIALIRGRLRTAVRFFGRAAHLNPDSPWYSADFALSLWMRDHKVLGLRRWNSATGKAGYDPRLIYDQSLLARMGQPLLPIGLKSVLELPGWEFVSTLWGESVGERRIRPMPSFIGPILPAPILPGLDSEHVRKLIGLPSTAPIHSHRYLIWDYRFKNYRLSFSGRTLRIAEFFGKIQDNLPRYPSRPISDKKRKHPEDDPVAVFPYARIAYLRFQTIRHQWLVQRVDSVLDRFIALSDLPDTSVGISREGPVTIKGRSPRMGMKENPQDERP